MEMRLPKHANRFERRSFLQMAAAGAISLIPLEGNTAPAASKGFQLPSGIINTIAGGGPIGEGGPAIQATLSSPFSIGVDAYNNVYIADNFYHRVYKVDAASQILTTVAGTGDPGFSGDNGDSKLANLNFPYGISVSPWGDIGIADSGNQRIRLVEAGTGIITTVAGTGKAGYNGDGVAAQTAQLKAPHGVTFDVAMNVYIADSSNNRIRFVNRGNSAITLFPASDSPMVVQPGQIATLVGTGEAGFSGDGGPAWLAKVNLPWGVALGPRGNLYVADFANNRVRAVNLRTGVISTLAGNGQRGDTGDGGQATQAPLTRPVSIAFDNANSFYIGQEQTSVVRRVSTSTGIITTVAGKGGNGEGGDGGPAISAKLSAPTGVTIDRLGNLLIAEYNNGRVRKVDSATQIIRTYAGSTNFGDGGPAVLACLNEPNGFSFDRQNQMFFSDQTNHCVRKVDMAGMIWRVAGTGVAGYNGDGIPARLAQVNQPSDAQFDRLGNLYICDRGNNRIRRIDISTGLISTVAGTGIAGFSGDGGPATLAKLNEPRAIWINAEGNLYISELNNFCIRFVNLSDVGVALYPGSPSAISVAPGVIVTVAGTGVSGSSGDGGPGVDASVNSPRGVTTDLRGNLYITEGGRDTQQVPDQTVVNDTMVRKLDASTGIITTVVGTREVGYNGDNIPATQATLNGARNCCVDADGNIFVTDSLNNRIRYVDASTGLIFTICGGPRVGFAGDGGLAAEALIYTPRYVLLDRQGNLSFSDISNSRIRKITLR